MDVVVCFVHACFHTLLLCVIRSILVEEALATYDYDEIGHVVNTERGYASAAYCAVTLGSASVSFLTAFGQIDPNLSTGKEPSKGVLISAGND